MGPCVPARAGVSLDYFVLFVCQRYVRGINFLLFSFQAYQECERITGIFAKTFYLGTKFMSPVARKVRRLAPAPLSPRFLTPVEKQTG